jgi:hypothetical protein
MYSPQSSHVWLCRFSLRLRELRPEIQWERAVACAVRAYGLASDLSPEAAATVHAKLSGFAAPDRDAQAARRTRSRQRPSPLFTTI